MDFAGLDSQIEIEKARAEAKAKAEIDASKDVLKNADQALQVKLNQEMSRHIENDKLVQDRIQATAGKIVEKGIQVQENKVDASVIGSENQILEADFEKNKDEYLYHGIDHKIDKEWKRKIIHVENDIWFVIWAIVSFFSIVPVSTFLSRIKALRGLVRFVAVTIGVAMVLLCMWGLTYFVLCRCGVNVFGKGVRG